MLKNKKNVLTTAIIGAIATTLMFTAQVDAKGKQHKGQKRGVPVSMFSRIDANQDGFLELDELLASVAARTEQLFTRKDTDEDGLLSFEEATTSKRESADVSDIAEDIAQCVADASALDETSLVQAISADRFTSKEDRFAAADTSGDEVLDLIEVQEAKATKATEGFEAMDVDDNGQVSEEEFIQSKLQAKATREAVKTCIGELTEEEAI
jgi:Ca2+-binding EF-hand superfamily protein